MLSLHDVKEPLGSARWMCPPDKNETEEFEKEKKALHRSLKSASTVGLLEFCPVEAIFGGDKWKPSFVTPTGSKKEGLRILAYLNCALNEGGGHSSGPSCLAHRYQLDLVR